MEEAQEIMYEYKHKNRKLKAETMSKLEMTEGEINRLQEWVEISLRNKHKKEITSEEFSVKIRNGPSKIIFDTDLGTDIDDTLALLMLLEFPAEDVEILGITTVYGHTKLRTKICEIIIDARDKRLGRQGERSIPIVTGEGVPLGTHRDVWHSGTEGLCDDLQLISAEEINKLVEPITENERKEYKGAKFIIQQIRKYPKEVTLVCLGAMTNVALALHLDNGIPALIKQIVFMGMGNRMTHEVPSKWEKQHFTVPHVKSPIEAGNVYSFFPNHNISCDTLASVKVFESGIKISVINDTVTTKMWWNGEPCNTLLSCATDGPAELKVGGLLLKEWLDYRSSIFNTRIDGTCPHDALATAEAVYPGKFVEYVRGHVLIHEWAGFSSFVEDPTGPHRIGVAQKNTVEFLKFMSEKILAPCNKSL